MESRQTNSNATHWLARLNKRVRRAALFLLILVSLGVIGAHVVLDRLDEQIRQRVESHLAEKFPGLKVTVRSARLVEGKGIEFRVLRISDPAAEQPPMVEVDEVRLACTSDLQRLLTEDLEIHSVLLRRPRLRARINPQGGWNLQSLLTTLDDGGQPPPPVYIQDGVAELTCLRGGAPRRLKLRDMQLQAAYHLPSPARPSGGMRVGGTLRSDHFQSAEIDSWLVPQTKAWSLGGKIVSLELSPELRRVLPLEVAERVAPLAGLRGRATFEFSVSGQQNPPAGRKAGRAAEPTAGPTPRSTGEPLEAPILFSVAGRLRDGRISDPEFPYAFTDLAATFRCDNAGFTLTDVSAASGQAELGLKCASAGYGPGSPLRLVATARKLPLDARLKNALPRRLQDMWDKFAPDGMVSGELSCSYADGRWKPELHLSSEGFAFTFHKFPYRVNNASGSLHLVDGNLTVDLTAPIAGQHVTIDAEFALGDAEPVGFVEIDTCGLIPLDDKLISALNPRNQRALQSLNPSGQIRCYSRFERFDPKIKEPISTIVIDVAQGELTFDRFPYPLNRVEGRAIFKNKRWVFERFVGYNDTAFVSANGSWSPRLDGTGKLEFTFDCDDVPLDEELRGALGADAQDLWGRLRPRGAIDSLTIVARKGYDGDKFSLEMTATKRRADANVEGRSVTLEPTWLPHRWDDVIGTVHYRDGQIDLNDLHGVHGKASLGLSGHCELKPQGAWTAKLHRIHLENAPLDGELITALPARMRQRLNALKLSGPLRIDGWANFSGNRGRPEVRSNWNLRLDLENGGLEFGVPIRSIRGGLRLQGEHDGRRMRSRGRFEIDSMVVNDTQLTKVRGPVWIDDRRVLIGRSAPSTDEPRSVTANVVGGVLSIDGESLTSGYRVWMTLNRGEMSQILQESNFNRPALTGKVRATLQMRGNVNSPYSWRGGGVVALRDADIYELPVMVQLLKLLSIRPPDKTAFTKADINYRVVGQDIYLDRIDFSGDAISLKGSGEMDFQRNINLQFYTLVGRERNYIPFIQPVFSQASRNILLIDVKGTLKHPIVDRRAFPELREGLQQLFPEADLRTESTWRLPRLADWWQ